ncbi:MAG: hypothetical protein HY951_04400 [Bacteroidia bacterium]|nr:hypothetical protein [Bacteroidia bacterium]
MIIRLMIFVCLTVISCNTITKNKLNNDDSSFEKIKIVRRHFMAKEVQTLFISDRKVKKPALVKNSELPDSVYFQFERESYALYNNGKIDLIKNDTIVESFQLSKDLAIIERAFFYSYNNNLIVFFSDTDHDSGGSLIECFEKPSYKSKWKNQIGGFNLSDPIIIDSLCYVASIGFIGKLNLNNGNFFWQHDNLYDTTRISSFSDIEFSNGVIHFNEELLINKNKKPNKIIVDDETGEIYDIQKNLP